MWTTSHGLGGLCNIFQKVSIHYTRLLLGIIIMGAVDEEEDVVLPVDPSDEVLRYIESLERKAGLLEDEILEINRGEGDEPQSPTSNNSTVGPNKKKASPRKVNYAQKALVGTEVAAALERAKSAELRKAAAERRAREADLTVRKALNRQVEEEQRLVDDLRQAEEREVRAIERLDEVEAQLYDKLMREERRASDSEFALHRTTQEAGANLAEVRAEADAREQAQAQLVEEESARMDKALEEEKEKTQRIVGAADERTRATEALCEGQIRVAEEGAKRREAKAAKETQQAEKRLNQAQEAAHSKVRLADDDRNDVVARANARLVAEQKDSLQQLELAAHREARLREDSEAQIKKWEERARVSEELRAQDAVENAKKIEEAFDRVRKAELEKKEQIAHWQDQALKAQKKAQQNLAEVQRLSEELSVKYAEVLSENQKNKIAALAEAQAEMERTRRACAETIASERSIVGKELLRMEERIKSVSDETSEQLKEVTDRATQDVKWAAVEKERVEKVNTERVAQAEMLMQKYLVHEDQDLSPRYVLSAKQDADISSDTAVNVTLGIDLDGNRFSPGFVEVETVEE